MHSEKTPKNTACNEVSAKVSLVSELPKGSVESFLIPLKMAFVAIPLGKKIPGSFWGDSEAGLISNRLYARPDTPLHSVLHETCHFLCMDDQRKTKLHTNAGGDYDEENAVCYLQILLAATLQGYSSEQCMNDMDLWGYTFRLGSAKKWFVDDADEAKRWLTSRQLHPRSAS